MRQRQRRRHGSHLSQNAPAGKLASLRCGVGLFVRRPFHRVDSARFPVLPVPRPGLPADDGACAPAARLNLESAARQTSAFAEMPGTMSLTMQTAAAFLLDAESGAIVIAADSKFTPWRVQITVQARGT